MRKRLSALAMMVLGLSAGAVAQDLVTQLRSGSEVGKTSYVMFYRGQSNANQRMAMTIDNVVSQNSARTQAIKVDVNDPSAAALVQQYDATRIPLPSVFALAPNGAVAGVFRMKVAPQQLLGAILTRKHAEMIRTMQDGKIAAVCFQPAGGQFVPSGVQQFQQDPNFKGQVNIITVAADEPGERNFFGRLNVSPNLNSPVTLLFVPPGTHLGTFNANVSGNQLAQKVHDSGKCNCESCKKRRRQ